MNTPGAVEIYQDSSTSAVRQRHMADNVENSEADNETAFKGLSRNLTNVSVSGTGTDGEGCEDGFQIKAKRAKFESKDDDFLPVWGIHGVPSGSAKGSRDLDQEEEPKPKKTRGSGRVARRRDGAPLFNITGGATASLSVNANIGNDDSTSVADPRDISSETQPFAASQSWLFGGKHRVPKSKGQGKGCKDVEATEKVLSLYDALKTKMESEDSFMTVVFKKVSGVTVYRGFLFDMFLSCRRVWT